MNKHIVKVLKADFITHNVKRFVLEKPVGYSFVSGQATDVSINKPGFEEELRPFTFTSVNDSNYLEFIIKIYSDHDGITKKLGQVIAGDELIVHDVFGTISYRGAGLYIAAGAGITPFISIFRDLKALNKLAGNTLLFGNRTAQDVILEEELQELLGGNFISIVEKEEGNVGPAKLIDRDLVKACIKDSSGFYY
ncbi:MAG: mmoC, partial [Daejeonella sp.]|nr:mmoC [Daejeonella sp.]